MSAPRLVAALLFIGALPGGFGGWHSDAHVALFLWLQLLPLLPIVLSLLMFRGPREMHWLRLLNVAGHALGGFSGDDARGREVALKGPPLASQIIFRRAALCYLKAHRTSEKNKKRNLDVQTPPAGQRIAGQRIRRRPELDGDRLVTAVEQTGPRRAGLPYACPGAAAATGSHVLVRPGHALIGE